MLNSRTKTILISLIILGIFLRNTGYTDADLFAQRVVKNNLFSFTTLSFTALNTANNNHLSRLLDVSGLVPYGFSVTSYRLKKDGNLSFKYHLKANFIGSDNLLCNSLTVKLMQDGNIKYQGHLKDLSYDSSLISTDQQDWVIFLGLDDNNSNLKNKVCLFELNFRTWRQNISETTGIFAQQKIPGTISSGTWE